MNEQGERAGLVISLPDRIASKFRVDPVTDCWVWTAAQVQGYGRINVGGKSALAHRVVYELLFGAIQSGLTLDHLCRNRACVNPDHLEPVDHTTNVRRGESGISTSIRLSSRTHCANGHEYTVENTYVPPLTSRKQRQCRICVRAAKRRYNARKAGRNV